MWLMSESWALRPPAKPVEEGLGLTRVGQPKSWAQDLDVGIRKRERRRGIEEQTPTGSTMLGQPTRRRCRSSAAPTRINTAVETQVFPVSLEVLVKATRLVAAGFSPPAGSLSETAQQMLPTPQARWPRLRGGSRSPLTCERAINGPFLVAATWTNGETASFSRPHFAALS